MCFYFTSCSLQCAIASALAHIYDSILRPLLSSLFSLVYTVLTFRNSTIVNNTSTMWSHRESSFCSHNSM